ncbi:MAG: mannose-1-phosphate guanylyltransferase [Candidatus Alcyoniella australis]|nr:mannose-1-phosphate guanylyltransferase [Candidatus Alcyoniella australis]
MRHAVIMAGGTGTRFWPRSRENKPKQLLAITGEQSLLRQTFERLAQIVGPQNVWIVTSEQLAQQCMDELPELQSENVLAEPLRRNTAPCVGLAAAAIERRDSDAVLGVFPADHLIGKPESFAAVAQAAYAAAEAQDVLVTLGVEPFEAATGYGYIEFGEVVERIADQPLHSVVRFIEKPERERAQQMIDSGGHFWNAGIFFFSARAILAAIDQHMPQLGAQIAILRNAADDEQFNAELARIYPQIEPQSIDNGVMEHASNLRGIPVDIGWSDLGAWTALAELLEADQSGNVNVGRLLALDSSGCIVHSADKLVTLIGVDDLVVVTTDDAVLVCDRKRAQEIKRVFQELKDRGWEEYL